MINGVELQEQIENNNILDIDVEQNNNDILSESGHVLHIIPENNL